MHISQKLRNAQETGEPVYSFEYFVPKTEQVGFPNSQNSMKLY